MDNTGGSGIKSSLLMEVGELQKSLAELRHEKSEAVKVRHGGNWKAEE